MVVDTEATQAMHSVPTPRIGGLAIIMSFALFVGLNSSGLQSDVLWALAAGVVVFGAGFKEDIFRDVSPGLRLLAAFFSAGAAIYFSGSLITRLDLPGESYLLEMTALWVVVTLVWSAGTCHAVNLIDGLNGLASGYVILATTALSLIAFQVGDTDVVAICLILIGSVLGFFVFNWPFGKIFLGDAGAYGVGHILAWLGIILSFRNPEISSLALLLVLFWPVTDVLFTIVRRLIYRRAIDLPDRFHFHHLLIRIVRRLANGKLSQVMVNSLTTFVMFPFLLGPTFLAILFWNRPVHAFVGLLVCIILFLASYIIVVDVIVARRLRRRESRSLVLEEELKLQFERSSLSGVFVDECLAVDVVIERKLRDGEWTLKAVADQAAGKTWAETFKTDLDAWEAFMEMRSREGIEAIIGFPTKLDRD